MSNLKEIKTTPKTGRESFANEEKELRFQLIDFWKWNQSDLISNANRGKLAEFIVAMAIDYDHSTVREEWDAFDLITANGIKIEVKSAAYIQSWKQTKPSKIQFGIKPTHAWEGTDQNIRGELKRQSDVYVMCLLKHQEQETLDPMKLEQWEFYVVSTALLNEQFGNQKQISLASLKRIADPCLFAEVKNQIDDL